jgi:hypothetical protein
MQLDSVMRLGEYSALCNHARGHGARNAPLLTSLDSCWCHYSPLLVLGELAADSHQQSSPPSFWKKEEESHWKSQSIRKMSAASDSWDCRLIILRLYLDVAYLRIQSASPSD